jgi:glycine/D-amino acid oxidase-like deaminating enzyme
LKKFDVVIIGGGIIGSSISYFLSANKDFSGSIAVIEPEPGHQSSSTGLSVGGIRQQFSTPLNIRISQYCLEFISKIDEFLEVDGYNPNISFVPNGYLSLCSQHGLNNLRINYQTQSQLNTGGIFLNREELSASFPFLNTDDLAAGVFGQKKEGWVDPHSLLKRFANKAIANGVEFIRSRVTDLAKGRNKIDSLVLEKGEKISGSVVVNAAGPRAFQIAEMAGISYFPVRPRKRFVYVIRSHISLPDCPLVVDPTGVYFRPEGRQFLCGMSPPADQDPDTLDLDIDNKLFEEVIWPVLANRVPAFNAIRREHTWAGHYAYNIQDQNAILGFHPGVKNMILANGFSGHGLQQAPAVGRGLSELITYGNYKSLDLSPFSFDRFKNGQLIKERMVV